MDEYLTTDRLLGDLSGRTVRSGAIRVGAQAVQLLVFVGTGMVLARLLTPGDFGLFAMVLSLTGLVGSFRDFGFRMATVQREGLREEEISALFWVTQKLNGLTVLFVVVMAPVLVWFYGEARLLSLTMGMAGGVWLMGLSIQHESLLARQMRFGSLTVVELIAILAGSGAALTAAVGGVGYWALAVQFVVTAAAHSAGVWLACGWRPRRPGAAGATPGLSALLAYGRDSTAYNVLIHVGHNLDRVLVGYLRGAGAMGLYDNSYRWSRYPLRQVFPPLLAVAVAGLSRLRGAPAAYREAFAKGTRAVYGLLLPMLAFMVIEAHNLIVVLLGDQWLDAVPLFQLLSAAGFADSLRKATDWAYMSEGRPDRQLRWGLIYAPVMVVAVGIGARWGALGVAIGFAVASWLLVYPAIRFCARRSALRAADFVGAMWRPIFSALLAAALLYAARPWFSADSSLLELVVRLPLFIALYLGAWLLLPGGGAAARDLLRLTAALKTRSPDGRGSPPGDDSTPPTTSDEGADP